MQFIRMQALQRIENRIDALLQVDFPSEEHEAKFNEVERRLDGEVDEYEDWHTDTDYQNGLRYYHKYNGDFIDKEIIVNGDLRYSVSNSHDIIYTGNINDSARAEQIFWGAVSELLEEYH
jgi:hypothetical protein